MNEHEALLKSASIVLADLDELSQARENALDLLKWFPSEIDPVRETMRKELVKIQTAVKDLRLRLGGKPPPELAPYDWPLPCLIKALDETTQEVRRLRARNHRLRTILRTQFDAAASQAEAQADAESRERLAEMMREAFAADAKGAESQLPSTEEAMARANEINQERRVKDFKAQEAAEEATPSSAIETAVKRPREAPLHSDPAS